MKTIVKTTIKGYENLYVKQSVNSINETLQDKSKFIILTSVSHSGKETEIGVKKTTIQLFKAQ